MIHEYYCEKCQVVFCGDGDDFNEHYDCGTECEITGTWG